VIIVRIMGRVLDLKKGNESRKSRKFSNGINDKSFHVSVPSKNQ
jgi:hypothetical protein